MHQFDNLTILCGPEFNAEVAYADITSALRSIDVEEILGGLDVEG